MIFLDSNVPMYLVGAEHPNRAVARRILERLVAEGEAMVTSAEVFQEMLHRYVAIRRFDAIAPAFETLRGLVDAVFSIEVADVEQARRLVTTTNDLSARDALHAAVMEREQVERILSFDGGFDALGGITRVFD